MSEFALELRNITKSFQAGEEVLRGISLYIRHGEFITLLGASGCGKTTTLRIIAGLESPDQGQVFLDGTDVTELPPDKRNVNMVFQNYALFPHMNVGDNVGYGLRLSGTPRAEIQKRVAQMLELVRLPGYEKRKPNQLSGGQRQRVAIARALINNPKVLLLDEPLGALDLQLRRAMQHELKQLQKSLNITFVYITHDQEEAINLSDRIAVMNNGGFEQIGTPDEIYYHPATSYAARFVGNANILKGKVLRTGNEAVQVETSGGHVLLPAGEGLREGEEVTLAVRSENVRFDPVLPASGESGSPGFRAVVREKTFTGGQLRVVLEPRTGESIVASRYGIDADVAIGQEVYVYFEKDDLVPVDRGGTHA